MKIYRKIGNAIESLKSATNLKISLRGERFIFSGLNSPYVSHQRCEIGSGHYQQELVVLSNNKCLVAVTPLYNRDHFQGDVAVRTLPAHLVKDLFTFPATAPVWLKGLVVVAVKDGFNGYDEAGRPTFRKNISGKFGDMVLFLEDDQEDDMVHILGEWSYSQEKKTLFHGGEEVKVGQTLPEKMVADYDAATDDLESRLADIGLVVQCPGPEADCTGECNECQFNKVYEFNLIED